MEALGSQEERCGAGPAYQSRCGWKVRKNNVISGCIEAARGTSHPWARFVGRDLHKWRAHFPRANEYPRREEYSFFSVSRMLSKFTLLGLLVISRGMSCVGHDDHDKDQMPLDYVRYPYQATYYPGDDSGPRSSHPAQRSEYFDHDVPL